MSDADVATRAPESDFDAEGPTMDSVPLEEPTAAPSQTPEQPQISDHCTTDRPLPPSSSKPIGDLDPIGGIPCYVSKPSSYPSEPSRLLLLLTGGTGLLSTNNQLQADAWAQQGYVVVMPDQFSGDPAPSAANTATSLSATTEGTVGSEAGAQPEQHTPSIIERVKLGLAEGTKSFMLDMWLARHTPATVEPILQKVLAGCKEQYADAVANGDGIFGVGYCFGAKYILRLCGDLQSGSGAGEEEKGEIQHGPALKAGAVAHGTLVTKEDIEAVEKPIWLACCRDDPVFPDSIVMAGRESFKRKGVKHGLQYYDSPHGFAVVGDYEDESIQKDQKDAFEAMSGFLQQQQ